MGASRSVDAVVKDVVSQYCKREAQAEQLARLVLGTTGPDDEAPLVLVSGPPLTGKSSVVRAVLKAAERPAVFVDCRESATQRDVVGSLLSQLRALPGERRGKPSDYPADSLEGASVPAAPPHDCEPMHRRAWFASQEHKVRGSSSTGVPRRRCGMCANGPGHGFHRFGHCGAPPCAAAANAVPRVVRHLPRLIEQALRSNNNNCGVCMGHPRTRRCCRFLPAYPR